MGPGLEGIITYREYKREVWSSRRALGRGQGAGTAGAPGSSIGAATLGVLLPL